MSRPLERSQSVDQEMRSGGTEENLPTQGTRSQTFRDRVRAFRDRILGRSEQREVQSDGVEANRPTRGNRLRAFRDRMLGRSDRGSEVEQQTEPEQDGLPSYGLASAEAQVEKDRAALKRAAARRKQAEEDRDFTSAFLYDPDRVSRIKKHEARRIEKESKLRSAQSERNLADLRRAAASMEPPPPLPSSPPGYGEESGLESEGSVSRSLADIEARRRVMAAKRRHERQQDRENDGNDNDQGGLGH
jgi:hypothetical protein